MPLSGFVSPFVCFPQRNSFNQGVARQAAALRFGANKSRTLSRWANE